MAGFFQISSEGRLLCTLRSQSCHTVCSQVAPFRRQVCPLRADEMEQMEDLRSQLQTALNRGSVTESERLGKKFEYCVTCMNRGQQALIALLINAVLLLLFCRKEVRIA